MQIVVVLVFIAGIVQALPLVPGANSLYVRGGTVKLSRDDTLKKESDIRVLEPRSSSQIERSSRESVGTCPICFQGKPERNMPLIPSEDGIIKICAKGHKACHSCIVDWKEHGEMGHRCPMCRSPITYQSSSGNALQEMETLKEAQPSKKLDVAGILWKNGCWPWDLCSLILRDENAKEVMETYTVNGVSLASICGVTQWF